MERSLQPNEISDIIFKIIQTGINAYTNNMLCVVSLITTEDRWTTVNDNTCTTRQLQQ